MIDLEFRKARPEDADQVVDLIYESSKELIDYNFRFGPEDPRPFLKHDFARGEGLFGYQNQLVGATAAGAVVATSTVYQSRYLTRLTSRTTLSGLGHFGPARLAAVIWRSLNVAPLFIKPRTDGLFIANVCVAANYRGRGVCSSLFAHACRSIRDMGLRVAELDVSLSNARAQRLYERLGFKVIAERPYLGGPALEGFRRMEKQLKES